MSCITYTLSQVGMVGLETWAWLYAAAHRLAAALDCQICFKFRILLIVVSLVRIVY